MLNLVAKHHYTEDDGKIAGSHSGAHYFTIGQRKGLAVGGTKNRFYYRHRCRKNIIYTGQGKITRVCTAKGLYKK